MERAESSVERSSSEALAGRVRGRARLCRQPQQPFMNEAPEGEEGLQLQEQPVLPFIHPLPFSNTMSYFFFFFL